MRLTFTNATLACLAPRVLRHGSITIDGGSIAHIGAEPPEDPGTVVDCASRLVMPGNVCGHTHLYSALARGMPGPARTPANFPEILELIWWRLDRALDQSGIRYSGSVGVLDAIRAGTTTLIDHHASPNAIDGSLDILADAFDEIGARGVLCYEVTDRNGVEGRDAGLRENDRFLREPRERVRGVVGAHASFTLEKETLEGLAGLAERHNTGVHIHVAEDICDEEDSLKRWGVRAAERLRAAGLLRPQSIVAHGVHLDDAEMSAVQTAQSWLVHNCRSNMNNGVGRARVGSFGERAALGTDGIDEDMFSESRAAFFRAREDSGTVGADHFAALLSGGGRLASEIFDRRIGTLEQGAAADVMILDYDPPTPLTEGNLAWHWMFAMTQQLVHSVMVDGQWVLRDHEFVSIDEERVRAEARAESERLWRRMEALR